MNDMEPLQFIARALKTTVVLDPSAVGKVTVPNGVPQVAIQVMVGGRIVKANLNAKSLRRAVTRINEIGVEDCAVILQGRLEAGDLLVDAGIAAQPKAPRPSAAETIP